MHYSECSRDKLFQYKIGGPSKPFIDQNLQLQIPEQNILPANHCSHSPIYVHYVGSSPSASISLQVNETEIYQAIQDAEQSYHSWKKMQKKVNELYASFVTSSSKN